MININKNLEPTCPPPDPPKPMENQNGLTKEDVFIRVYANKNIQLKEAIETYANSANWKQIVSPEIGCIWTWNGPTIRPYDLAKMALKIFEGTSNIKEIIKKT